MPSQTDESHIATLYASPILLRDALKNLAIEYMRFQSIKDNSLLSTYKKASHPAFKDEYQPIEGDGFFMGDLKEAAYPNKPKIHGVSSESTTLLLKILSKRFDDSVRCLESHKTDGWYDAIGPNVVAEIDLAYATQSNSPIKALDRVAPMLAKLEPLSPVTPHQRKGPLL